jgi:hypothetical protein
MSNQILISSGAKLRDLDDVIIGTDGVLSSLAFNVANGVPKLDENGKILVSQLPNSVMEFKGVWNAATNTPTLANGTGNAGDVYLCNVAGTVNFGAGPITFAVGDYAVYTGSVWARSSGATGTVTSVGLSRDGDALSVTGSPITTSGTINIGFTGTNLQYINGAGNLTTFPSLTGYVPYIGATGPVDLGAYDLTVNELTIGKGTSALSNNTALGHQALFHITTGNYNTGVGHEALHNTTTGAYNTALGQSALFTNTTGGLNTAIGVNALLSNTTGGSNVVIGLDAMQHNTTGSSNTALGYNAGSHITGGGTPNTTSGSSVYIGRDTKALADGGSNEIVIGYNVTGNGSNTVTIGNSSITANYFIGSINGGSFVKAGGTSSQFLKADGSVDSNTYLTTAVTSVGLSAPTGFSVTGSPVTSSGTLALSFASGYSLPTNVKQSNWDDAYTWVAAFPTQTGNNGKFLTTNGSALSWATVIAGVQSVTASSPLFSSGGSTPNITIQVANTSQNGYLSSTDWNTFNGKQTGSTNLTSLAALTYASTSFVKMTASGTFALDTNTYALASTLGDYVTLATTQTITGAKTFSLVPTSPTYNITNGFTGTGTVDKIAGGLAASGDIVWLSAARVSAFISLGSYVPYTGATSNVDLGIRNLTATTLTATTLTDGLITISSAQINRTDALVELQYAGSGGIRFFGNTLYPILFAKTTGNATFTGTITASNFSGSSSGTNTGDQSLSGLVPYTGATNSVDLGTYGLTAASLTDGYIIYSLAQINRAGNFVEIQYNAGGGVQFFGNTTKTIIFASATGDASFSSNLNIGSASTSAKGLTIRNGGGASRTAYVTLIGTNAASANATWYSGVNVFATDASYEIKTAAGKGILIDIFANIFAEAFISKIGASDTIGGGSNYNWNNNLTGTSNRQLALQMNAANGLSLWYYNGSSWANTNTFFSNNGVANFGSSIIANSNSTVNGSGVNTFLVNASGGTNTVKIVSTGGAASRMISELSKVDENSCTIDFRTHGSTYGPETLFSNSATNAAFILGLPASGTVFAIGNYNNGALVFGTNNTERSRITAGGNTLINTTTDTGQKLQLSGTMKILSSSLGLTIDGGSGALDRGVITTHVDRLDQLALTRAGVGTFAVKITTGNVAILSAYDANINILSMSLASGASTFINTVTSTGFFDVSDKRLKTLVEDNYLLSSIANVKAKLYIKGGRKELGYYAQDLENILPSSVSEGSDGFLSLSYAQVHTAKIAVIEDEVTVLKNRVSELETKLQKYDA